MKRTYRFILGAALVCAVGGAFGAIFDRISHAGLLLGPTGSASYVGPGDVVSGAYFYWGLRAYNHAYAVAGSPIIQIDRTSDSHVCNVAAVSTGGLSTTVSGCTPSGDTGTLLSSWCASTTCLILSFYEQTGVEAGGSNAPTVAVAPVINFTGCSSGSLPCSVWASSAANVTKATMGAILSQPYSVSAVAITTGTTGAGRISDSDPGASGALVTKPGVSIIEIYSSAAVDGTMSANAWHAIQGVFNHPAGSSASFIYLDGSSVATGDPGGTTLPGVGNIYDLGNGGGSSANGLDGKIAEVIGYNFALTLGQSANLNSNQHTYWGF